MRKKHNYVIPHISASFGHCSVSHVEHLWLNFVHSESWLSRRNSIQEKKSHCLDLGSYLYQWTFKLPSVSKTYTAIQERSYSGVGDTQQGALNHPSSGFCLLCPEQFLEQICSWQSSHIVWAQQNSLLMLHVGFLPAPTSRGGNNNWTVTLFFPFREPIYIWYVFFDSSHLTYLHRTWKYYSSNTWTRIFTLCVWTCFNHCISG